MTKNDGISMVMISAAMLLCSAIFVDPVFAVNRPKSPKEVLVSAKAFFDKGHYDQTLIELSSIDVQRDFDSSDDMKSALKIRAIAYDQTGQKDPARETIRELFFLKPDYDFDPFDTPQSVVEVASREKAKIEKKSKDLSSIKLELADKNIKEFAVNDQFLRPSIVEQKSLGIATLLPLGLNHFYVDSRAAGTAYLASQALGLATNITGFWWKQSFLVGLNQPVLRQEHLHQSFKNAQFIQYLGLGAMVVSYAISIIHALVTFSRDQRGI